MGSELSAVRQTIKEPEKAAQEEMEQRLRILEKMINLRLQNETSNILAGKKNDQEIDTGTIVAIHRQIYIKASGTPDTDPVAKAIKDFFSGESGVMSGLKAIIKLGADVILGNTSIGEYESSDMFIVWSNNALLRCDTYYYRWNFVSEGVISVAEGVSGCLLVKRVIDLTKTDPQVLTWAITEQCAKSTKPVDADSMISSAMHGHN